jgi:hypothetical protein
VDFRFAAENASKVLERKRGEIVVVMMDEEQQP